MNPPLIKAIGLFSGGLDSMVALKVIEEQGIEVEAVSFVTPFFGDKEKLARMAKDNAINLTIIDFSKDYIQMVKSPRYGYGKAMNPCIDCKISMLKAADKYAREVGAHFVFTGEVVGLRPMSQNSKALQTILTQSGLDKKLVRPLSGKLLPPTEAEENGWLDREKLLDISGHSRERQLDLARHFNLTGYGTPAGGCLLSDKQYAKRLGDLLQIKKRTAPQDIRILKAGRYFRVDKNIIIVGRNQEENEKLETLQQKHDWLFHPKNAKGPITLLRGTKNTKALYTAAAFTAYYCDSQDEKICIGYGQNLEQTLEVPKPTQDQFLALKKEFGFCEES